MDRFRIRQDETLLFQENHAVLQRGGGKKEDVNLLLTDKNLYYQTLSNWTGKVTDTKCIPLDSVSIVDGKAQVSVRTQFAFRHFLVITTQTETFEFYMASSSKFVVQQWVDFISKIVEGKR